MKYNTFVVIIVTIICANELTVTNCKSIEEADIYLVPGFLIQEDRRDNSSYLPWAYSDDNSSLISVRREVIAFSCFAPFPVVWNITGYIYQVDSSLMYSAKIFHRQTNNISYELRIIFWFGNNQSATCSRVKCQSAENSEVSVGLKLFMKGTADFVDSKRNISVINTETIPCTITHPAEPVQIKKFNSKTMRYEIVSNGTFTYDPQIGFTFLNSIVGEFMCTTLNDKMYVTALETTINKSGYQFFPSHHIVKTFTTNNQTLKCRSTLGNVTIETNGSFSQNLSFSNGSWMAAIEISSFEKPMYILAFCKTENSVIMSWEVELVVPPIVVFNYGKSSIQCVSNYYDEIAISAVRCSHINECEFYKQCFKDSRNTCIRDSREPIYFSKNDTQWCSGERIQKNARCTELIVSSANGVVECKVRGLSMQSTYFTTLDLLKEFDYTQLHKNRLVQMDEPSPVIFTNVTTRFVCKALQYFFAENLEFQFLFSNKSTMFVEGNGESDSVSSGRFKVNSSIMIAKISVIVPPEVTSIKCLARMQNSTKIYFAEKLLTVKHFLPASFQTSFQNIKITPFERTINCSAIGYPAPKYKWKKHNETIDRSLVKFSVGEFGESLLEFKNFQDLKDNDEYFCEAENEMHVASDGTPCLYHKQTNQTQDSICGLYSARKRFVITKEGDSPMSTAGLVSVILVFTFLVVSFGIAFLILIRRHLLAKELLRDLTDNEISEFVNGNPEIASSSFKSDPTCLNLAPYNRSYELSLDEIDFDSSKVLGEGQFSIVLQAKLKHGGEAVAVKVAKASANVELFKSLLSEIKVMIHIGNHQNVVSLAGVCTEGIRKRTIHIVLEMCANGSLDVFLRKSKKEFLNLLAIKDSQVSWDKAGDRITTMNLIKWSENVSSGMEFLSTKGIVHADLAARNVLIDSALNAKISDFGLSRRLYESTNYIKKSKTPLPWRWMALESLQSLTFSAESDVWSFGVMLWEIFTLGDIPFPNETWNSEFVTRIATGMRMGKPEYSSREIFSMIAACWERDQSVRPTFPELRIFFSSLTKTQMVKTGENPNYTEVCEGEPPHFYQNCTFSASAECTKERVNQGVCQNPNLTRINLGEADDTEFA